MSLALSPMPLMNPRRANTVAPSYHPISSPNRFSPRVKPSPLASSKKGSEKEQTKQTSQRKKNTLISRSERFMKNQSYGVLSNHRGQFWQRLCQRDTSISFWRLRGAKYYINPHFS